MGSVDFSRGAGLADKSKSMSTAEWGDLIPEQLGTSSGFDCWRFTNTKTVKLLKVHTLSEQSLNLTVFIAKKTFGNFNWNSL